MKKDKGQKAQSERFISKAKELGVDESGEAFERAFKKVVPPKHKQASKSADQK